MKRLIGSLLAVVFLAGLASQASAQTPRPKRKGKTLKVSIDSSPQGATIYLDSKEYGIHAYTPWTGKLTKGSWTLILEKDGFQPLTKQIEISKRGQAIFFPLDKQILPGTIEIISPSSDDSATGATVILDGQNVGTVPGKFEVVEGRHQIMLTKEGHENSQAEWVDLKQGQTRTMSMVLKKIVVAKPKGSILVSADVDGAEVFVDTVSKGVAPALIADLEAGPHVVEVRKAGIPEWRQTVTVVSGETVKVSAGLKAQMPQAGSIRVLAEPEGAEIYLDGELKGNAPVTIPNVGAGTHILEVKAAEHDSHEQNLEVVAGKEQVLKIKLKAKEKPTKGGVDIRAAVPGAVVIIDGTEVGPAPLTKGDMVPGPHIIIVKAPGYKEWKQTVQIKAGETLALTPELAEGAKINFLSDPVGATISINDKIIGQTPLEHDIKPGKYSVTFSMDGYLPKSSELVVVGGKDDMLKMELEVMMTGPSDEEIMMEERRLTSFGARVIKPGKFTADLSAGYPYIVEGRLSVGAIDSSAFGLDASIEARLLFANVYEFDLSSRLRLIDKMPLAIAAFGQMGGGDGRNGRNTFFVNGGAIISLTFQDKITFSGRAYANVYSDRLCPEEAVAGADEARGCHETDTKEIEDVEAATGEDYSKIRERDNGLRLMVSAILEVAFSQRRSFFVIFEGPPFQSERALFKDAFNAPMAKADFLTYLRMGITLKF